MQLNKPMDINQYLFFKTNGFLIRLLSFNFISKEGKIILSIMLLSIILSPILFETTVFYCLISFFISFLVGRDLGTSVNIKNFEKKLIPEELQKSSNSQKVNAARRTINTKLTNNEEKEKLFFDYLKQEYKYY